LHFFRECLRDLLAGYGCDAKLAMNSCARYFS